MRLIDILNSLHFAGADFFPALEAARLRKRLLRPVLRRILAYAAEQPRAYNRRFAVPLLAASAFLLAEFEDPEFLALAQPLVDPDADPSLLGYYPEDAARLIARAAGPRITDLVISVLDDRACDEFRTSVLEATVLVAAWHPERRDAVAACFRTLLRDPKLGAASTEIMDALAEGCCRLGPEDFLLDLHLAVDRGAFSEDSMANWLTAAGENRGPGVWLDTERQNHPITPNDPFLRGYSTAFRANEFKGGAPMCEAEIEALDKFNSIAAPCVDYEERFSRAAHTPGIGEVARRVVALAVNDPEEFSSQHHCVSLSAAICLGASSNEAGFIETLVLLLRLPEQHLDRLLGDDLTEMCEWALAVAGRCSPAALHGVIEDTAASISARSVTLGALLQQVRLGFSERDDLADYVMKLFERRHDLSGNEWFWSDVADIGAELGIPEMLPLLLDMEKEGVFAMADGGIYTDAEELTERFANPRPPEDLPAPSSIDALYLLHHCSGHESMTVRDFLGRLAPPRYAAEPTS